MLAQVFMAHVPPIRPSQWRCAVRVLQLLSCQETSLKTQVLKQSNFSITFIQFHTYVTLYTKVKSLACSYHLWLTVEHSTQKEQEAAVLLRGLHMNVSAQ